MRDLIAEVTMSRAPPTLYGPLHEFAASLRLEFSKSIGCKNGMVLKGIKRHAAWLKDHPRGKLGPQRSKAPAETLPLLPFFGGGVGGSYPGQALCDPALAGNKDSGNDGV